MDEAILSKFSPKPTLLGEGIESRVYVLGNNTILRIYKDASKLKLKERQKLSDILRQVDLPFDVPLLHSVHELDGTIYTIENQFSGDVFSKVLPKLKGNRRKVALENYLKASGAFTAVVMDNSLYGDLLRESLVTNDDWVDYLKIRVSRKIENNQWIKDDVNNIEGVLRNLNERLDRLPNHPTKNLVHGDFYPANVYIDKNLEISAVGDFSGLSVVGDFRMDIAGAVYFAELGQDLSANDKTFLKELAASKYGEDILEVIKTYMLYYSAIFLDSKEYNPETYQWSIDNLNSISLQA